MKNFYSETGGGLSAADVLPLSRSVTPSRNAGPRGSNGNAHTAGKPRSVQLTKPDWRVAVVAGARVVGAGAADARDRAGLRARAADTRVRAARVAQAGSGVPRPPAPGIGGAGGGEDDVAGGLARARSGGPPLAGATGVERPMFVKPELQTPSWRGRSSRRRNCRTRCRGSRRFGSRRVGWPRSRARPGSTPPTRKALRQNSTRRPGRRRPRRLTHSGANRSPRTSAANRSAATTPRSCRCTSRSQATAHRSGRIRSGRDRKAAR